MKTIPGEVIQKVWSEMGRFSESRMSEEANRFLRQQPYLVRFLQEFTDDLPHEVQQLSLYLAYLIWKVFTQGLGRKMPRLSWPLCYHSFLKERRSWKESKKLLERKSTQPVLIQCLRTYIEEDHTGSFKKDVERGSFLMILKSVIAAFEKAASQL